MISFEHSDASSLAISADLLIVPVGEGLEHPALAELGAAAGVDIVKLLNEEHFKAKIGSTFVLRALGGVAAPRVVIVGTDGGDTEAGVTAAREARALRATRVAIDGRLWSPAAVAQIAAGFELGAYHFDRHLSKDDDAFEGFESVTITQMSAPVFAARLARARSIASGVLLARDLVNESPNHLVPETLAQAAVDVASEHGYDHRLWDESQLVEDGFNLITAVGRGSEHPPRLVHLTYRPAGEVTRKVALVGKGVTFDTGGYNIKPGTSMLGMHCDMAGAAAVIGAAQAIGGIAPAGVEIHFIVPTAENAIAHNAYKPQDIFRGYGGKTVEIHNTDAEGRLLLADALAYACELGVDEIVDLATLTGACVVALGEHTAGLFCDDEDLTSRLLAGAELAGEHVWRMPLTKKLDRLLDTPYADMKNVGSRWGGAITAALFLNRWVDGPKWAHLDIAGPAFAEKPTDRSDEGGTGFAVATLVEYLTVSDD